MWRNAKRMKSARIRGFAFPFLFHLFSQARTIKRLELACRKKEKKKRPLAGERYASVCLCTQLTANGVTRSVQRLFWATIKFLLLSFLYEFVAQNNLIRLRVIFSRPSSSSLVRARTGQRHSGSRWAGKAFPTVIWTHKTFHFLASKDCVGKDKDKSLLSFIFSFFTVFPPNISSLILFILCVSWAGPWKRK